LVRRRETSPSVGMTFGDVKHLASARQTTATLPSTFSHPDYTVGPGLEHGPIRRP